MLPNTSYFVIEDAQKKAGELPFIHRAGASFERLPALPNGFEIRKVGPVVAVPTHASIFRSDEHRPVTEQSAPLRKKALTPLSWAIGCLLAIWGNGITTEAARAVVAFGFESLDLLVLTSGYFEDNPASGQVLQKLGFLENRRVMRPCLAAGGEVPSIRMQLPHSTRG